MKLSLLRRLNTAQAFAGAHEDTNPHGAEAHWYLFWTPAFEGLFKSPSVYVGPQFELYYTQLTNNDTEKKGVKRPDFAVIFLTSTDAEQRDVTNWQNIPDAQGAKSLYRGVCQPDESALLTLCEVKGLPKIPTDRNRATFRAAVEQRIQDKIGEAREERFEG